MPQPAPAKVRFASEIRKSAADGRELTDLFALASKSVATSSRDRPYLRLSLADKTGKIDGFVWENALEFASQVQEGDIVQVQCRPQIHKETPQLRVDWLRPLTERELEAVDRSLFRPGLDLAARRRLWDELVEILSSVQDPYVNALLAGFTADDRFRERFLGGTAAKSFHHAYIGGLVEHTLAVARLAATVAALYPDRLNRDVLLAGAFLHDAAKVEEFDDHTGDYTDAGRLVGHLSLGIQMVRDRAGRTPGFPEALVLHLQHLILSHHSRPDWGSPVKPQTLEAIALHFLDNLDAKVSGAWAWLLSEEVPDGGWSSYWRGQESQLLRTPRLWSPGPARAAEGFEDLERQFLAAAESETSPTGEEDSAPLGGKRKPPEGQTALF